MPRLLSDLDKTVGPDEEVWVRQRIETALKMAIAAFRETKVRADSPTMASALDGIANGAAVEVIRCLGLQPGYVNLRRAVDSAPVNTKEPDAKPERKLLRYRTCCSCGSHMMNAEIDVAMWAVELDGFGNKHSFYRCPPPVEGVSVGWCQACHYEIPVWELEPFNGSGLGWLRCRNHEMCARRASARPL